MTTKAINNASITQLTLELKSSALERAYWLAGAYRIRSSGSVVDVEVIDIETLRRSVIYARPDSDVVIFLPSAKYEFYLSEPFGGGCASVHLVRIGIFQRIYMLAKKAINLVVSHPTQSWAALGNFMRKRRANVPVAFQSAVNRSDTSFQQANRVRVTRVDDNVPRSVSIIIPTKERYDLLRSCIESLSMIVNCDFEIIIVDNGATGSSMLAYLEDIANDGTAKIIRQDIPFNFSRLCNEGARAAKNPVLLFLNDDIEAIDGKWLTIMLGYLNRNDAGVVGARLLYPSGELQHGGIATNLVPGPGHPWRLAPKDLWDHHPLLAQAGEVDAVTGACLMIRSDIFGRVGGFNEIDFAVTLNDVDLCLRVRQLGLKVFYTPEATLLHKEGQTRNADDAPEEQGRYTLELKNFFIRYQFAARNSTFFPKTLRRDSDKGIEI